MKSPKLTLTAVAICLTLASAVFAETMTKADFSLAKNKILVNYKASKALCSSLSGNAKDVCQEEAKASEKISLAELDEANEPSIKSRYETLMSIAEAHYEVAKEKCDDLAGNVKDICVKEAEAGRTAGKADAIAQRKIAEANKKAVLKTDNAQDKATVEKMEARTAANADKLDAQYKVEKEKCETYAGGAKDTCQQQAKVRFGK